MILNLDFREATELLLLAEDGLRRSTPDWDRAQAAKERRRANRVIAKLRRALESPALTRAEEARAE